MKKIIKQLKKELNLKFIFAASLLETLLLILALASGFIFYRSWPKIKEHFAAYKVCGQVLEYGSNASVPDFRIDFGDKHMYSIYDGSYCWEGLSKGSQLNFTLPSQYESERTIPADYTAYRELSPFFRQVEHNIKLVLGVEATARRVFDYQRSGVYYNLWNYLSKNSKTNWSNNPHDFTQALSAERSLRSKFDESHIVDYEILNEEKVKDNVYCFEVLWTRSNGDSYTRLETFAKEDGWWHYNYPRLPKEIYDYIYVTQRKPQ